MSQSQQRTWRPDMNRMWMKFHDVDESLLTALAAADAAGGDGLMHISDDGVRFEARSPSRYAVVRADATVEFDPGPETVTMGVNISSFYDACVTIAPADPLSVRIDRKPDHESDILQVIGDNVGRSVPVMDPDDVRDFEPVFDLDRSTTASVNTADFKSAVGTVTTGRQGYFVVRVEDGEVSVAGGHSWKTSTEESFAADVDGPGAEALFRNDTLGRVVDALPVGAEATLVLGDDFPLTIQTDQISATVAPRVEPGDER